MGLSLEVGILADLKTRDPEGFSYFLGEFAKLNEFLKEIGLPEHEEPDACEVWSGEMFGYSGLHYLRRFAAHVEYEGGLPPPGDENSSKDPVLEHYYEAYCSRPGLFATLLGRQSEKPKGFNHLIIHGDAEGYYLPIDFPDVLFPPDRLEIPGGMVGSTQRLRSECERLRELLQIPPGLDQQSDQVFESIESQGEGTALWERYAIESFSCLGLLEACEASLKAGAAIVFM